MSESRTLCQTFHVADFYEQAKHVVVSLGFQNELEWQHSLQAHCFSESDLLRESAWVILCSGFRETIVRRMFDHISLCFCDWESARTICELRHQCRSCALSRFSNMKKIDAILRTAEYVDGIGFEQFKARILTSPIAALQVLPFIGPVTAFHLAKNLGMPLAKPDRHLRRLARDIGYADVQRLCSDISKFTGDSIQVVDLVLWRYAERIAANAFRTSADVKL